MRSTLTAAVVIWAILGSSNALATPVNIANYRLDVIFSTCLVFGGGGGDERACALTDPVRAGVTYSGNFTIDASALETDGYKNVGFETFYFSLGGTVWDSTKLFPESDFSGSRWNDPTTVGAAGFGPWTLLVQNGELAGICCGVYGVGDVPFMDLYSWPLFDPNPVPIAHANVIAYLTQDPYPRQFFAQGAFSIHRVPEPGPLLLLSIGLAGLLWCSRNRYQPVRQ